MIGSTALGLAAGPLYTQAVMGQLPSTTERPHARTDGSKIPRQESIRFEELDTVSRDESDYSIHWDDTTQPPYVEESDSKMMTQNSLLGLPPDNDSYRLAMFLRTTAPPSPHRKPSKVGLARRTMPHAKEALRFLRIGRRAPSLPEGPILQDEGGLLSAPPGVEQKLSSQGTRKRYFAIQPPPTSGGSEAQDNAPMLSRSPSIVESRISVHFTDGLTASEHVDGWFYPEDSDNVACRPPTPPKKSPARVSTDGEASAGAIDDSVQPVRPAASCPPTPEPVSAVSMADSYRSDLNEHPAVRALDIPRVFSTEALPVATSSSLPLPDITLPYEDFPVRHPGHEKDVEIKHPSPRRLASHTVLLNRASSLGSSLYRRSFSDSPGPPPAKSPLRSRRDAGVLETVNTSHTSRRSTPRTAPSIIDIEESDEVRTIKPTVITECTGPIKRPKSRGKSNTSTFPRYIARKDREERTRARKLRDRPLPIISSPTQTIDAIVNAPPPSRQRLRKARPHIQIPDLRPAPLATRASSSASSNGSWKKITENTRTPVSAVPSERTPISTSEKTGYTPISPTASNGSGNTSARMALSPVMLVAEEVPVAKNSPRPAKIIVKESRSYAPRPRSASIPRSALKRRSRSGVQTPTRPDSPERGREDDAPPLPSPPPNRALPPTPPASGSERPNRVRQLQRAEYKKELPSLPKHEIAPRATRHPKESIHVPHVATQRKDPSPKDFHISESLQARLDALEKHNALLSAALEAVIRTNGALNAPLSALAEPESPNSYMSWEARIARRSHAASSSNGSALDMYMSTRRGSRHGM